jgi:hypothetical protein
VPPPPMTTRWIRVSSGAVLPVFMGAPSIQQIKIDGTGAGAPKHRRHEYGGSF